MIVKKRIEEALTEIRLLPILEKLTSERLVNEVDGRGIISYSNRLGILNHNIPKLQSLWKELEHSKRYEPKIRNILSLTQNVVNYQYKQDKRNLVESLLRTLKRKVKALSKEVSKESVEEKNDE